MSPEPAPDEPLQSTPVPEPPSPGAPPPRPQTPARHGVDAVLPAELPTLLAVWEASVRTTHAFLSEADIAAITPLVLPELRGLPHLHCVRDADGAIVAFSGVTGGKLEALFVLPEWQRAGLGRRLARHAITELGATTVDVSEQNPVAVAFYRRLGFEVVGRSPVDSGGRPFPLLHLRLREGSTG
jgi:putative acetyltransferase